jgi:hypothetical protein
MHEKTLSLSLSLSLSKHIWNSCEAKVKSHTFHSYLLTNSLEGVWSLEFRNYGSYGEWSLHQVTIPHCSALLFCSLSFPLVPVRSSIHACWQPYWDLNVQYMELYILHSPLPLFCLRRGLGFCGEFLFELRNWWSCVQGCVLHFRTVTLHSGFMMVRQSVCMSLSFPMLHDSGESPLVFS